MKTRPIAVFSFLFVFCSLFFGSLVVGEQMNYVGGKESKKYHRTDCELVKRIYKDDKVPFESSKLAEKDKYRPCLVCCPDRPRGQSRKFSAGDSGRPVKAGHTESLPNSKSPPAQPNQRPDEFPPSE